MYFQKWMSLLWTSTLFLRDGSGFIKLIKPSHFSITGCTVTQTQRRYDFCFLTSLGPSDKSKPHSNDKIAANNVWFSINLLSDSLSTPTLTEDWIHGLCYWSQIIQWLTYFSVPFQLLNKSVVSCHQPLIPSSYIVLSLWQYELCSFEFSATFILLFYRPLTIFTMHVDDSWSVTKVLELLVWHHAQVIHYLLTCLLLPTHQCQYYDSSDLI